MSNVELLKVFHDVLLQAAKGIEAVLDDCDQNEPDTPIVKNPAVKHDDLCVFHEKPAKDNTKKRTDVLTIREAANRAKYSKLGISETAIREMIKTRQLSCTMIGNRHYISWISLLRALGLKPEDKT